MDSPGLLIFKMRALELGEFQGEGECWTHTARTPGDTSKNGGLASATKLLCDFGQNIYNTFYLMGLFEDKMS